MSKLPRDLSGRNLVKILSKAGWKFEGYGKGSHMRLSKEGRADITVPDHDELDAGTLRGIIEQAGLSRDDFMKLYETT